MNRYLQIYRNGKDDGMDYRGFINQVMQLPFINDEKAADGAIKAVLGILASKVSEEEAIRLTNTLPPEINFGVLRGHQQKPIYFSLEELIAYVGKEFQLNTQQAANLIYRVFHCVKESEEVAEVMEELESGLPGDWADAVDRA